MSTLFGTFKAGRVALVTSLSLTALALVMPASAQQRVEKLRTPTEKSFLNPGSTYNGQKSPGYVVDGMIGSPAYGNTDKFYNSSLPPVIGAGGRPLYDGKER
ncbi:hypothetical protein WJT86_05725 [Microvirga sp. W0021]|uniref:Uncharacterized protein n=1 Tax=Hohaiivirga grylli TaxID=3133970 RepID=A0ABV0BK68_9HYPH